MTDRPYTTFNRGLRLAVRHLRDDRLGWTQEKMARALGVELETYKKYESRSAIPHFYIPRLCLICRITIDEFYLLAERIRPLAKKDRRGKTKTIAIAS